MDAVRLKPGGRVGAFFRSIKHVPVPGSGLDFNDDHFMISLTVGIHGHWCSILLDHPDRHRVRLWRPHTKSRCVGTDGSRPDIQGPWLSHFKSALSCSTVPVSCPIPDEPEALYKPSRMVIHRW